MVRTPLAWIALGLGLALPVRAELEDPRVLDALRVDPFTRTVQLVREDLRVAREGNAPFAFERVLAPGRGHPLDFGASWAGIMDAQLHRLEGGETWLQDEHGALFRIAAGKDGERSTETGLPARLEARRGGGWQLVQVGRELRFDTNGQLLELVLPHGTVSLERGPHGRPVAIHAPGGTLRLERAEGGLLRAAIGPDGTRVEYERDEAGNVVLVKSAGRQERYGFDAAGRLASLANGLGSVSHDELGLVTKVVRAGRPTIVLEPAGLVPAGNAVAIEVVRGGVKSLCLVATSLRRFEERPDGSEATAVELDPRMRPVRIVRGARVETISWDAEGRIVERKDPEGTTRFAYASASAALPTTISHSRTGTLRLLQDARGRLIGWQSPDGRTELVKLDEAGRPLESRAQASLRLVRDAKSGAVVGLESAQETLTIERDALGRATKLARKDGSALECERLASGGCVVRARDATGRVVRETEEDALGRTVRLLDPRGRARTYAYDGAGNVVSVSGPQGVRATWEWDAEGELTGIVDALGRRTSFSRPDARTLVVDDPVAGKRTLRHDASGRLVELLRGEVRIGYSWDANGRLVKRDTPAGPETFTWDAGGRLLSMSGPDGGLAFAWDDRDRLVKVEDPALGQSIAYRWDEEGRRIETRYPWGTVRHERDATGALVAITGADGQRIELARGADGRRTKVSFPNGVTTALSYEGARLTEIRTARGDDTIDVRRYGWGQDGRLDQVEDLTGRTRFEHDALGRLISAGDETWRWDEAGNRLGGEELPHDDTGNLTAHRSAKLAWDHHGRLSLVTLPSGKTVRYGYAPNGTRLWREDERGRTRWLHDLAGLAGEFGPDGKLVQSWLLGEHGDDVLAVRRGERSYYFHQDLVRNVTALSDGAGKLAARYAYDAFGVLRAAEGPAAEWNSLRFASRPCDPATGLVDLRARNYAPELGRFVSPDPAFQAGGLNLHAYVEGDPTASIDSTGLWPGFVDDAVDAVGDIGGAVVDGIGGGADWVWDRVGSPGVNAVAGAGEWFLQDFALGPNHNPFFFGGLPNPFALEETLAFGRGLLHGTFDLVAAPFQLVHSLTTDPLGTLRNLGNASLYLNPHTAIPLMLANGGRNPVLEGALDLGGSYLDALINDPERFWDMTGYATPQVAAAVATAGGSSFLSAGTIATRLASALTALNASTRAVVFLERLGKLLEVLDHVANLEQVGGLAEDEAATRGLIAELDAACSRTG